MEKCFCMTLKKNKIQKKWNMFQSKAHENLSILQSTFRNLPQIESLKEHISFNINDLWILKDPVADIQKSKWEASI